MPQAATSVGQPRPISRLVRAGRPYRPPAAAAICAAACWSSAAMPRSRTAVPTAAAAAALASALVSATAPALASLGSKPLASASTVAAFSRRSSWLG
eukprot:scaffold41660_cov66-Phaeocystis_antarctica.AAC.2